MLLCAPCMCLGALPHDCPPVGGDLPVGSCPPEVPGFQAWKGKRLNTHFQSVSLSGVSIRSGGREAESLKQSHVFPSCGKPTVLLSSVVKEAASGATMTKAQHALTKAVFSLLGHQRFARLLCTDCEFY